MPQNVAGSARITTNGSPQLCRSSTQSAAPERSTLCIGQRPELGCPPASERGSNCYRLVTPATIAMQTYTPDDKKRLSAVVKLADLAQEICEREITKSIESTTVLNLGNP